MSQHHDVTVGIDIGDRYSHLCLLDTESGEVIEEGRILTNHSAFEKRFSGSKPMRIAIETGTHSPWISRMLEECGHDVLVANARKVRLIYGERRRSHGCGQLPMPAGSGLAFTVARPLASKTTGK